MSQSEEILSGIYSGEEANHSQIVTLLQTDGNDCRALYSAADDTRREYMGDEVYLRGIIEFSNICKNHCRYCGISIDNRSIERYRMSDEEILQTARSATGWGCGTVVLQSGVDPGFSTEHLCRILKRIKAETGLAVTLSIGVLPREDLAKLKEAGCDRYLLRFETSDRELFAAIHPDESFERRIASLHDLRDLGYQVGSGFMIGLPGATPATIAEDILFTTQLSLDMIGCGPFLSHPDTALAGKPQLADISIYYKTIAILRLLNPTAHIPATTAFDALESNGRNTVLQRGANVFMPNITPGQYRGFYQLYPNKPCVNEDGAACSLCVAGRLAALNRPLGAGPGHSRLGTQAMPPSL